MDKEERWVIALYKNNEFVKIWDNTKVRYFFEERAKFLADNFFPPTPGHHYKAGPVSKYIAEIAAREITNE